MSLRIISTTLFDKAEQERYQPYLPMALRAHHNLYKGWIYRIYHDGTIDSGPYGKSLRRLAERGLVELRFVSSDALIEKAMLWRLLPLWDELEEDIELFCFRDIDMVAPYRERCAVETWIRSGLMLHSMSDYKRHHDYPSLNGMMGFRVKPIQEMLKLGRYGDDFEAFLARADWPEQLWRSNYRASGKGADERFRADPETTNNQFFLKNSIWLPLQKHACEHRLSGCQVFPGTALSFTTVEMFHPDDLGVRHTICDGSDSIIPFIGASMANSDINLEEILHFYQEHGDPEIERVFKECEL